MDSEKKAREKALKYNITEKIIFSKIGESMSMKLLEKMNATVPEKKPISEHFKFLEAIKTKHKHRSKERNDETTRTINMIENTFRKKYDSDYIRKICQLLKKKDKNYSKKRHNLDKTKPSIDENNNLYLTLPKFDYGKRIRDLMKDRKELEKQEEDKKKQHEEEFKKDISSPQPVEDFRSRLERLIPEFYINQKTLSDESDDEEMEKKSHKSDETSELSELDENAKKNLFERMKTKNNFYLNTQNNKNYNNNKFTEFKNNSSIGNKDNFVLPFLPTKINFEDLKNKEKSTLNLFTENSPGRMGSGFITDLDIKNAAASKIYREKHQPKGLLETDPNIINIRKIREKFKVIKNMEKKKEKILAVDLFNYDKKKWQKKNLKESERIIFGLKEFEDRRNDMIKKIYSNIEANKNKDKKENEE